MNLRYSCCVLIVLLLSVILLSSCSRWGNRYDSAYEVVAKGSYDYIYVDSYKFTDDGWFVGKTHDGKEIVIHKDQVIRITFNPAGAR